MKSLGLTQSYMYISGLTVTTAFLNFIMLYTLHGNAYSQKVNYHRLLITVHTESTLTKRRHFWGRLGFMTKVETWLNANKCEMGTFSRKQLSKIGRDFEMAREGFGIKCLKMLSVELFTVRTVASMSKFCTCLIFRLVWHYCKKFQDTWCTQRLNQSSRYLLISSQKIVLLKHCKPETQMLRFVQYIILKKTYTTCLAGGIIFRTKHIYLK